MTSGPNNSWGICGHGGAVEQLQRSIVQDRISHALLLAGPALSLPSILVIRSVVGNAKTAVFVALTIVMATIAGMGFGALYPEKTVIPTLGPVAVATVDGNEVSQVPIVAPSNSVVEKSEQ